MSHFECYPYFGTVLCGIIYVDKLTSKIAETSDGRDMRQTTSYAVYIKEKEYQNILKETLEVYRAAVDYFINVRLENADQFKGISRNHEEVMLMEHLVHKTKENPEPKYDFDSKFYKFPSEYRRDAMAKAIALVKSYESNLLRWDGKGKEPKRPKAGYSYPTLYKGLPKSYERTGDLTAKIKIRIRNTWDWIDINLRKTDVDYINKYCSRRREQSPLLQRCGKRWKLSFPFEETVSIRDVPIEEQIVLSVDLGINNACACTVMTSEGTILGRKYLSLPKEEDSLNHALNRIKKAQQHGARSVKSLWAVADGINKDIAVKTAHFIDEVSARYGCDTVVFEHLDTQGKKKGSKKQRLHLWKSKYVQKMMLIRAHRRGMRVSTVNAWNTSRLAYDGSGKVLRGKEAQLKSYSLCRFQSGKIYNCDLNAVYNIGARYIIREKMKSLPETERLAMEAKEPSCARRSTCTLSTLYNLNAALAVKAPQVS